MNKMCVCVIVLKCMWLFLQGALMHCFSCRCIQHLYDNIHFTAVYITHTHTHYTPFSPRLSLTRPIIHTLSLFPIPPFSCHFRAFGFWENMSAECLRRRVPVLMSLSLSLSEEKQTDIWSVTSHWAQEKWRRKNGQKERECKNSTLWAPLQTSLTYFTHKKKTSNSSPLTITNG